MREDVARSGSIDRRAFLQDVATGGLVLVITATGCRRLVDVVSGSAVGGESGRSGADAGFAPVVYLRIAPSGDVTVIGHRSEMGQGSRTSLAMIVADELEADWARVRIEQAPGDEKTYGSQNTDGSSSIRGFFLIMRQAGATARAMLEAAAAAQWGVPVTEVTARLHRVVHERTGRAIDYGDLTASARTLPVPAPDTLRLKQPSEYRYIGKPIPMVDQMAITMGQALYGNDQRLPEMLIAVIARPPVYGGTVTHLDAEAAQRTAGVVRVVQMDHTPPPSGMAPLGGVAVLARDTWSAIQGRNALKVEWTDGPHGTYDSPAYRRELEAAGRRPGHVARNQGDVERALATARRRLEADYYVPHLSHAPMEPLVALASVHDGRCEVWAPTQSPQGARDAVAGALGMSADNVRVNVTLLGGAFGRKCFHDFIIEAALLSRTVGVPVKVQWTREDDMQHDYYHPPALEHLEAGLDGAGRVIAWLHRSVIPPIDSTSKADARYQADWEMSLGLVDCPYAIPNLRLEAGEATAHTRLGWYRSVLNIPHQFARSSFMDELAHATRRDPKAFILDHLGPDRVIDMGAAGLTAKPTDYERYDLYPIDTGRLRGVLELATQQAGWGQALPAGEGRGLAVIRASASYLASVVHVKVASDGSVEIPRIDLAVDAGATVHPDRVLAQMEGGTIMGLSNVLTAAITFARGRCEQSNFTDYRVLRIDAAPRDLRIHVVPSTARSGGVGEPAVTPTIPAVCNAIFAATGRRVRELPVRPG